MASSNKTVVIVETASTAVVQSAADTDASPSPGASAGVGSVRAIQNEDGTPPS